MSVYFKKETAGWQKPGREAALVSLGKGSLRAQRELAGSHGGAHAEPLLRGFDDVFPVPQSRHTTVRKEDIIQKPQLNILAESDEAGVLLVKSQSNREIFMTGHLEYDTGTLAQEYFRDVDKGLPIQMPVNYFPGNNSKNEPVSTWRSTAHLFYSNWLNYYVYQETPFNLTDIH